MILRYLLIISFGIILSFQNCKAQAAGNDTSVTIYVAKSYWHTGYILKNDSLLKKYLPVFYDYDSFEIIDIGMGDRDFYMDPAMDFARGAQALICPSPATIRIAGIPGNLEDLKRWRDYLIKIKISLHSFEKLCEYLDNSFDKSPDGNVIIIEERIGGDIVFYESTDSYHLFNTCNTWLAAGLHYAGLHEVDPFNVITSQNLFIELKRVGEVLKFEEPESLF